MYAHSNSALVLSALDYLHQSLFVLNPFVSELFLLPLMRPQRLYGLLIIQMRPDLI